MRTPYGAWRVTYTPGSWVALSGPTSMVVLQPIGAEASELLNMLWDELLPSASVNEVTARLTGYGLDAMPNLAVFFWEDDRLYCLLRGSVQVLDADTSQVLATGRGVRTWREVELASSRVQVLLEDVDLAGLLQLPLVIGAARVSSIVLDAEVASVPAAPQAAPEAVGPEVVGPVPEPEPQPEAVPEPEPVVAAQLDVPVLGPATPAATLPPVAVPSPAGPERSFEPTQVLGERPPFAPGQGPDAQPAGSPADDDEPSALADRGFGRGPSGTTGPWGPQGFATGVKDQPRQPEPTADETVLEPAAEPEPAEPEQAQPEPAEPEPAQPEPAPPLQPAEPEPEEAPVRAFLVTSAGDRVRLVRPVMIGRAPSSPGDDPDAELLRVPSPNHDISRNHLRIEPSGWQIEVTDLNSTNGTQISSPDGQIIRLEPGRPTPIEPGWTVDIGDGVTIGLEPPN